jgi:hypothetical protein
LSKSANQQISKSAKERKRAQILAMLEIVPSPVKQPTSCKADQVSPSPSTHGK